MAPIIQASFDTKIKTSQSYFLMNPYYVYINDIKILIIIFDIYRLKILLLSLRNSYTMMVFLSYFKSFFHYSGPRRFWLQNSGVEHDIICLE